MDPAERRTVDTLKASFKHIATTLDATCLTTRAPPLRTSAASAVASSAQPSEAGQSNTSLARILADHHRLRGSALRCLLTALDIDRLAIDKAHRHTALLHAAGRHREAGQAARAVRGYPPLLEVLHVVMEKNGVEEWDRWARRESNAERDEVLAKYVPFPFAASSAASPSEPPLPAPIAHLLPTLAERQLYDDPPPSPPHSPARLLPSLLPSARSHANGHKQAAGNGVTERSRLPDGGSLLKRAIEADDRAMAKRLAARRERERQQRLNSKKRRAIQRAEADAEAESETAEDKEEEAKEVREENQQEVKEDEQAKMTHDEANNEPATIDDEMDAEVRQLASMDEDGVTGAEQLDGSSPFDAALPTRPLRPQLLAGVLLSPTAADVSPVDGVDNGGSASPSPFFVASLPRINGDALFDSHSPIDNETTASPLSLSAPTNSWSTASSTDNTLQSAGSHTSTSSQPASRPVRSRKKAPRYGEDDLYSPDPQPRHHRPSPRKSADPKSASRSPAPAEAAADRLWEIDQLLCYRFRAYPPFHELAGSTYRSFLVRWKEYGSATWVMEDDLVSVDRAQMGALPDWDEWTQRPGTGEVEVEEEEPWLGGGEDGVSTKASKKRRRGSPTPKKKKRQG